MADIFVDNVTFKQQLQMLSTFGQYNYTLLSLLFNLSLSCKRKINDLLILHIFYCFLSITVASSSPPKQHSSKSTCSISFGFPSWNRLKNQFCKSMLTGLYLSTCQNIIKKPVTGIADLPKMRMGFCLGIY